MRKFIYTLFICFVLVGCNSRPTSIDNEIGTSTNFVENEKKDLMLGLLASAVVVLGLILLLKTRSRASHYDYDGLRRELESMNRKYCNLKNEIDKLSRVKSNCSVSIKDILRDEEFEPMIYDCIEKYSESNYPKSQQEKCSPEPSLIVSSVSHKVLYGSKVRDDGAFISMSELPNDRTVYELHVKGDTASVTIAKIAEAKIIATPEYLENGSNYNLNTDERKEILLKSEGRAVKQDNGDWKIINKVEIEFI